MSFYAPSADSVACYAAAKTRKTAAPLPVFRVQWTDRSISGRQSAEMTCSFAAIQSVVCSMRSDDSIENVEFSQVA